MPGRRGASQGDGGETPRGSVESGLEQAPPGERRGGGQERRRGVPEERSAGEGDGDRGEAGRRGGGEQADPAGRVAVENRAGQQQPESDAEERDRREMP